MLGGPESSTGGEQLFINEELEHQALEKVKNKEEWQNYAIDHFRRALDKKDQPWEKEKVDKPTKEKITADLQEIVLELGEKTAFSDLSHEEKSDALVYLMTELVKGAEESVVPTLGIPHCSSLNLWLPKGTDATKLIGILKGGKFYNPEKLLEFASTPSKETDRDKKTIGRLLRNLKKYFSDSKFFAEQFKPEHRLPSPKEKLMAEIGPDWFKAKIQDSLNGFIARIFELAGEKHDSEAVSNTNRELWRTDIGWNPTTKKIVL